MARYKEAIEWIAANDDTEFLDDGEAGHLSVTASLVVDLWGKDYDQVRKDLVAELKRQERKS